MTDPASSPALTPAATPSPANFPTSTPAAATHPPLFARDAFDRAAQMDVVTHSMAAALRPWLVEQQRAWLAAGLTPDEVAECTATALLDLAPVPGAPLQSLTTARR